MLVGEGFLTYDDLSIIEPDLLQEMGKFSEEMALSITDEAERRADASEQAIAYEKSGSGNNSYRESAPAAVSESREADSAEAESVTTAENAAEPVAETEELEATEDAEAPETAAEVTEDAETTAEPEAEATEDAGTTAEKTAEAE